MISARDPTARPPCLHVASVKPAHASPCPRRRDIDNACRRRDTDADRSGERPRLSASGSRPATTGRRGGKACPFVQTVRRAGQGSVRTDAARHRALARGGRLHTAQARGCCCVTAAGIDAGVNSRARCGAQPRRRGGPSTGSDLVKSAGDCRGGDGRGRGAELPCLKLWGGAVRASLGFKGGVTTDADCGRCTQQRLPRLV